MVSRQKVMGRWHEEKNFQLFILYGRRRVGKTTLLKEFCKGKNHVFYSAEQSNEKLNLEKFSAEVFAHYHETSLEPFRFWENALSYIEERQGEEPMVLVIDEFPYLAAINLHRFYLYCSIWSTIGSRMGSCF